MRVLELLHALKIHFSSNMVNCILDLLKAASAQQAQRKCLSACLSVFVSLIVFVNTIRRTIISRQCFQRSISLYSSYSSYCDVFNCFRC